MTLREAAEFLGRDETEVRKLAAQGIIPGYQQESRREWYFDDEELAVWAAANPKQSHKLSITDDELIKLCEGRTYGEVATMLGATASDIAYHMRRIGYPRYAHKRYDIGGDE